MNWDVIIDAFPMIVEGVKLTLLISIISAILAFILGTLAAFARSSNSVFLKYPATFYVEFFRNTPLLVQMYLYYAGLPKLSSILSFDPLVCGIIALSLYTGAYITEVVRSGIQSIAKEQIEASRALGLSTVQTMFLIIFPQAVRIIIPPLGNQFINLAKNSSLVSVITVQDVFYVISHEADDSFHYMEFFLVGCIIYMFLVGIISLITNLLEHYLKIPGRS